MAAPNLISLTSLTQKLLAAVQLATNGDNTVYTVPANQSVKIATATLCNTSGSAVTISVSLVPSGGSVDGTHKILTGYSLSASDTLSLSDLLNGAMLGPGDFISVNANASNAIDAVITGTVAA